MRRRASVLAGVALALLAACQRPPAPITEQDRAAVRASDSAFAVAVNENNVDGMMAPYAPDAMVLPPNMAEAAGTAAVRQLWTTLQGQGRVRLTATTGMIDGSGDVMYSTGTYQLQPLPADSTQPMPPADQGKYLAVWRRQTDGSWKIVRDAWSSNNPMPEPAPARRR